MQSSTLVMLSMVLVSVAQAQAAPGLFYGGFLPAPVADTKVYRDFLGNQATSYSYHDGHSSSVALQRNDVNKHIIAAPAPVAYHSGPDVGYAPGPPAPYLHATSHQYHHQYPGYSAYSAPGYYY